MNIHMRCAAILFGVLALLATPTSAQRLLDQCELPAGVALQGPPAKQGAMYFAPADARPYWYSPPAYGVAFCSPATGAGFARLKVGENERLGPVQISRNGRWAVAYGSGQKGVKHYRWPLRTNVDLETIEPTLLPVPAGRYATFNSVTDEGEAMGSAASVGMVDRRSLTCFPVGCRDYVVTGDLFGWKGGLGFGFLYEGATRKSFVIRDGVQFRPADTDVIIDVSGTGALVALYRWGSAYEVALKRVGFTAAIPTELILTEVPVKVAGKSVIGYTGHAIDTHRRIRDGRNVVGVTYYKTDTGEQRFWTGTIGGHYAVDQSADEWVRSQLNGPIWVAGEPVRIKTIVGFHQFVNRFQLAIEYQGTSSAGHAIVEFTR